MAEFITKEYKKKDKTVVKTEYRIDIDFVPQSANEICKEFMENYCVSKGKKELEWYINLIGTKKKVAKGNQIIEREISLLEIRKAFIEKFFPSIIKTKKVATRQDDINRLKEILNKM